MIWPQLGDKPFATGSNRKSAAYLDWMSTDNLGFLAAGFLSAGHFVVDGAAKSIYHADQFFFPAAFLYRHAIELQLKGLLEVGLQETCTAAEKKILGAHDLRKLWQLAKPLILKRWPEGDREIVAAAEAVIEQFHLIDPTGQGFRYTHDKKSGERYLQQAPRVIDLQHLKDVVAGTFNFLSGCTCGVGDEP